MEWRMNRQILLVDDDLLLREVVSDYLKRFNYVVDTAENAEQALALFEPGKYKLAILDLVMPGMNGLELMKELLTQDPDFYVIIMTGYPTVDSAYKAMVEGISDYIIKPFRFDELLQTVQKYIP
jgi:DNA-binding NtrC family response regulator